jgi:hypothetical protein
MSKIEVNAVEPQSGTTLTLGASGDTVALAAGALQTGFGRTGTVDWSSTIQTTGFTAVSGVGYFCDTSSAAFTVTLPANPSIGDIVAIKDWSSTAATNNITIARNGQEIEGNTQDGAINVHGDAQTLVFSGASRGWMVVNSGLLEGIQGPLFVAATGGTVLTCGNYKVHVFTGPGSFVVTCGGNDIGSNSVEYVVVAGGAGGGGMTFDTSGGGGGGAGGFRQNYPNPAIAGLPVIATTYPITVGGGGAGGSGGVGSPAQIGVSGTNSIFSTITSAGGGGGGGITTVVGNGASGGSGGGGGGWSCGSQSGGSGNTPPVTPSQGNPGGGQGPVVTNYGSGGGGGAGAAGGGGTNTIAGAGGVGANLTNPFFGPTAPSYGTPGPVADTRYFAGGGGGSTYQGGTSGPGGAGGGGKGGYKASFPSPNTGPTIGVDGTANTGGGGGGNSQNIGGKAGGSGIVVIRYKYQ